MKNQMTIESAKQFLKDNGYYTDNLWCVEDVKSKYECTAEQAQEVLDGALNNEATMEQIWFAIEVEAEASNLEKNKGAFFKVSGFWKDDKIKFSDYIIKELDEVDENNDEEIFFYGLSEAEIKDLISKKWDTEQEFVLTNYEKRN